MKHTAFYTIAILAIGFLFYLNFSPSKKPGKEQGVIFTALAPKPIGPYSQAVRRGNAVFVSGQIAIDPISGKLDTSDIASETKRVMNHIAAILKSEGVTMNEIAQARIYLTDIRNFAVVNEVYSGYFGEGPFPARETVQVVALPKGAHIEISVIAIQ
ncbi:MAG TPA: Rid family detoxifying hydrolase [Bacteroidia bacterium]|nr:Rid family detoxifying hydrolase [Bacteroidia bacterium]